MFTIPKSVADRMLLFGRVRLRDSNRLARSCGRSVEPTPADAAGGRRTRGPATGASAHTTSDNHARGTNGARAVRALSASGDGGRSVRAAAGAAHDHDKHLAQQSLAVAVNDVTSSTRAVSGSLGLIGVVDRVFAKGTVLCGSAHASVQGPALRARVTCRGCVESAVQGVSVLR